MLCLVSISTAGGYACFNYATSAFNKSITIGLGYSNNSSLSIQPSLTAATTSATNMSVALTDEAFNISNSSISIDGLDRGCFVTGSKADTIPTLNTTGSILECNHDDNSYNGTHDLVDSCVFNSKLHTIKLDLNKSIIAASCPKQISNGVLNLAATTEAKVVLKNSIVAGVKGMVFKDADAPYTLHENSILLGGRCSPSDTSNSLILACSTFNSTDSDKLVNLTDIPTVKLNNALMCGVQFYVTNQSIYNNALSFGTCISIGTNTTPDSIGHVIIGMFNYDYSREAKSVVLGSSNVVAARNSFLQGCTLVTDKNYANTNLFIQGDATGYRYNAKSDSIFISTFRKSNSR